MDSVPQRQPRHTRHTTIRFTGEDGVTWQGDGDGYAAAVRDLLGRRPVGQPADDQGEARWRLTPAGEAYLAGLRGRDRGRSPHRTPSPPEGVRR